MGARVQAAELATKRNCRRADFIGPSVVSSDAPELLMRDERVIRAWTIGGRRAGRQSPQHRHEHRRIRFRAGGRGGLGLCRRCAIVGKKGVTDRAHDRCARPRVRFGSAADVATIRRFGAELPKSDFPSTRLHDRQPAAPWLDADQGVSRCVVSISEGCIGSL